MSDCTKCGEVEAGLRADIAQLEEIETDLNSTISYLQRGVEMWKKDAELLKRQLAEHETPYAHKEDLKYGPTTLNSTKPDHITETEKKVAAVDGEVCECNISVNDGCEVCPCCGLKVMEVE